MASTEIPTAFYMAAPLIREYLLGLFAREVGVGIMLGDGMLTPYNPVPFLSLVLENLDTTALTVTEAYNHTTGYPSEHSLQGEIFLFLRSAFTALKKAGGTHWTALMEAKNLRTGAKRADLLLFDGNRILIELKAAREFNTIGTLLLYNFLFTLLFRYCARGCRTGG